MNRSAMLQRSAGVLLALQGSAHIAFGTPMFYGAFGLDTIWFIGAGLAMIYLGIMNVAGAGPTPRWSRYATVAANAVWLVLMIALVMNAQSWRTILAVALTLGCLAGSIGTALVPAGLPARSRPA